MTSENPELRSLRDMEMEVLNRGPASFLAKMANVANPAKVANAALRPVEHFLRHRASLACFICY